MDVNFQSMLLIFSRPNYFVVPAIDDTVDSLWCIFPRCVLLTVGGGCRFLARTPFHILTVAVK